MKKTTRSLLAAAMAITMVFAAAGCSDKGGNADSNGGINSSAPAKEEITGTEQTAGNISIFVPDGWTLQAGNAGGIEDDNSLFLLKDPNDMSKGYLWVQIMDSEVVKSNIEEQSTADISPFTAGGVEWWGKENAIGAEKDGAQFMIFQYGLNFSDEVVVKVLESVKKA